MTTQTKEEREEAIRRIKDSKLDVKERAFTLYHQLAHNEESHPEIREITIPENVKDACFNYLWSIHNYEAIKSLREVTGYEIPRSCFWNKANSTSIAQEYAGYLTRGHKDDAKKIEECTGIEKICETKASIGVDFSFKNPNVLFKELEEAKKKQEGPSNSKKVKGDITCRIKYFLGINDSTPWSEGRRSYYELPGEETFSAETVEAEAYLYEFCGNKSLEFTLQKLSENPDIYNKSSDEISKRLKERKATKATIESAVGFIHRIGQKERDYMEKRIQESLDSNSPSLAGIRELNSDGGKTK